MQFRKLGSQGPEISVVGYGAWEIGGQFYGPNPGEEAVIEGIRAALDAGMSWIDTAEVYGRGTSETLVGTSVRNRRDEVLIATKVAPRPEGTGFEPGRIRQAATRSIRRLGIDHIDLYQLHWFPDDERFPIEDTWGAMSELVDEGLVRYLGVSNFGREQIERCLEVRHVDSLQPQCSMLHREGEDLYPWCGERGIGVIAYGPLAYGLLTGAVDRDTRFHPQDFRSGSDPNFTYYRDLFAPGRIERNLEVVDRLRPVAERLDVTLGQLALAWTVHRPGVTAAIAGSRNPAHVRENARAGDVFLPPAVMEEIETILAGAGAGRAPPPPDAA